MKMMVSPSSLCEIKDRIHINDEKIGLLNNINDMLKERHEIETNYNHLHIKMSHKQTEENERKEKYDCSRKHYLSELENRGQELCKEHSRILHQVEHITWHLEGCTRHRPCGGGSKKQNSTSSNVSCMSNSATNCNRPSAIANLRNTSERFIKSIVDLRKKICSVQEKLECETKRKREMEKKLSELRKEISRQKKSLSVRRHNSHVSMATSQSSLTHCPIASQSGFCSSSLPPIKKPMMVK